MKSNIGLVDWCIQCHKNGNWYLNGAYFSKVATLDYIMQIARRLPERYDPDYIERSKKAIGKVSGDCHGLIKGYMWLDDNGRVIYPTDETIKKQQDISEDKVFANATIKGHISTIPEIPGVCVRYPGHVGVYIGNGEVIEARGVDYGVVKTQLKSRGWTDWYYYPGIIYEEDIMLKKGDKGAAVYDYQTVMKALGYNIGNFLDMYDRKTPNGCDGDFGDTMVRVTKEAEGKYKLPITGNVSGALYGKLAIALLSASPEANKKIKLLETDIAELNRKLKAEQDKYNILADKHKAEIDRINISHAQSLTELTKQRDALIKEKADLLKQRNDAVAKLNEIKTAYAKFTSLL